MVVKKSYIFPIPYRFTPQQAWEAYRHGAWMLRQPPNDRPDPWGGGWSICVVDEFGTRFLSTENVRELLGDDVPFSIWGESDA